MRKSLFSVCSRPTTQELGQENRESDGENFINSTQACKARRWRARINFMLLARSNELFEVESHEVSAIKAKNAALKRHSCTSSVAVVPIGFDCVGTTVKPRAVHNSIPITAAKIDLAASGRNNHFILIKNLVAAFEAPTKRFNYSRAQGTINSRFSFNEN